MSSRPIEMSYQLKLRQSAHNLAIERGRHQNVERRLRKCIYCDINEIMMNFILLKYALNTHI